MEGIPEEITRLNQWLNNEIYELSIYREPEGFDEDAGPIEVYPESGYTSPPEWQLDELLVEWGELTKEELAAVSQTEWV